MLHGDRDRLEWCVCKPRNAKDGWQPLEAGRGMERASPRDLRESRALLTPWFQSSDLQNCEMISFFLKFFPIYLFMAVLGLGCSIWPFSSCREWGLLSSCVLWPSIAVMLLLLTIFSSLGFELDIETEISGVQKIFAKNKKQKSAL